jgi:hypothetical protein
MSHLLLPIHYLPFYPCVSLVQFQHGLEAVTWPSRQRTSQSSSRTGRVPNLHLLWLQYECGRRSIDTSRLQQTVSSHGHYQHGGRPESGKLDDSRLVNEIVFLYILLIDE